MSIVEKLINPYFLEKPNLYNPGTTYLKQGQGKKRPPVSQEPSETESAILVTTYFENWGWLAGDELEISTGQLFI